MDELEKTMEPVVAAHGCRIVEIVFRREGRGKVLRLFIESVGTTPEKGSGVSVDLCARISRDIGVALDTADVIDGSYRLEVSSAGLDRPLKSAEDFTRFLGAKARIKTRSPIGGKRTFSGEIAEVAAGVVALRTDQGEKVHIPLDHVMKANLVPEIEKDLRVKTGE